MLRLKLIRCIGSMLILSLLVGIACDPTPEPGPAGPQGPAGVQGPPGPAGPAGDPAPLGQLQTLEAKVAKLEQQLEPQAAGSGGGQRSTVPGVTDSQVLLGAHAPLTGPLAGFSTVHKAGKAYLDYINATQGGVHGREIRYVFEDDGYQPPKAQEIVAKLVEQDQIFAMFQGFGTPTHLGVVDYLQEKGVPDLFIHSGASEWTRDPSARPTVFAGIATQVGQGAALGKYMVDAFPEKKLGLLYRSDAFGTDAADGVKRGVGNALEIVGEETYETSDQDLTTQVGRLKEAGAEVVVIWAPTGALLPGVIHARQELGWDIPIAIYPGSNAIINALEPELSEGMISMIFTHQEYETDHPGVAKHTEIIRDYGGIEAPDALTLMGQARAEWMVEILKRAGRDLTREGLVAAAESITDWQCSVCLFPGSFSDVDHDLWQRGVVVRAQGGKWLPAEDGISWEGTLPGTLTTADLRTVPVP